MLRTDTLTSPSFQFVSFFTYDDDHRSTFHLPFFSRLITAGGNKVGGVDHAKIAKLDREVRLSATSDNFFETCLIDPTCSQNEVAPPPTVSMELGKVIQQARQNFKDAEGKPKPMSQSDLAKAINAKPTIVQECKLASPFHLPQLERSVDSAHFFAKRRLRVCIDRRERKSKARPSDSRQDGTCAQSQIAGVRHRTAVDVWQEKVERS